MTQVLVAPSLRTPQGQARAGPASCGPAQEAEDEGAAGDQADGTHSQTLELRLEADSEAGTAADDESGPHVLSEAEEEQAEPDAGLQSKASDPPEEEQGAAADAGDDLISDAQSMLSDGADSYQGLPPETLAHLAASANESQSGVSDEEEAERDAAAAGQGGLPEAAACEQATGEEERQLPQGAAEPSTAAQTDPDAQPEQRDNHSKPEEEQLGDTVMEEQQSGLHMAADEMVVDTAGPARTSPAEALSSTVDEKWQAGAEIEVHCSDAPQVWSWRPATLVSQHIRQEHQVQVEWNSAPSAEVPSLSELVEVLRLRPVAPTESHIAETDMPSRGSVFEVDYGLGGGYQCAVLVGRRRTSPTGKQRDLDSMVHAILPGLSIPGVCCF